MKIFILVLGFACSLLTIYLTIQWNSMTVLCIVTLATAIFYFIVQSIFLLNKSKDKQKIYKKNLNILYILLVILWLAICIAFLIRKDEKSGQIYVALGLFIDYILFSIYYHFKDKKLRSV